MKKKLVKSIYKDIDNYYTDKLIMHGAIPKGVDWNSEEGQFTRFKQVSKIIETDRPTVNDIGCGYGKYLEYLLKNYKKIQYRGYDLSNEMIKEASKQYPNNKFFHISNLDDITNAEYSISSGIFNVKIKYSKIEWLSYILDTLKQIDLKSDKGFSFNMLTKYSEKKYMRDNLYYADPLFFFDYCKLNFSKNVSLIHDYNLYEFTILVKKKY
jgi:SAM-dependent methyltransferase